MPVNYMINNYLYNPLLPQLYCLPWDYASPVPQGKCHTALAPGWKSRAFMNLRRSWLAAALTFMSIMAGAADGPGVRALQQQQLQRQQQQESLQLRMQQQQSATQSPPQDAWQRQTLEQLQRDQARRQQELHDRQSAEAAAPRPAEDAATRRAKDEVQKLQTKDQGESLLRRSEAEQQKK